MLKGFRSRISITIITVLLITVIVVLYLIRVEEFSFYTKVNDNNLQNLIKSVRASIDNEYNSLVFHEKTILSERKKKLKDMVDLAYITVDIFYKKFANNEISEKEAKKQALKHLQLFRYDNNVGYIWINDTTRPIPRMIQHPILPHLNKTILADSSFNCALGVKKNLFVAVNDVCQEKGEGFVDYLWVKPTDDGYSSIQPKLSFVRLFKKWNWILGTGLYIDDIEKEKQRKLEEMLKNLRIMFGKISIVKNGYMFIINKEFELIVHPSYEGKKDIINPITNNHLLKEMVKSYKTGNKYFDYVWDRQDDLGNYIYEKRAFIDYVEPLNWYIVSSAYIEDLQEGGKVLWKKVSLISIPLVFFAFLVAIFLAKNISKPLSNLSKAAKAIKHKGINKKMLPVAGTIETKNLGKVINEMVDSLLKAEKKRIITEIKFKAVFDNSNQLWGVLDAEGKVIDANYASMQLIDESIEEIRGQYYWNTNWWNLAKTERNKLEQAFEMAEKGGFKRFEAAHDDKDGKEHLIDFSVKAVKNENGAISFYIVEGRDVTTYKMQEMEIKKLNEELETRVKERTAQLQESISKLTNTQKMLVKSETMASLGSMVAGVAHEINTPIGISLSLSSFENEQAKKLKEKYENDEMTKQDFESYLNKNIESTAIMMNSLKRASELVRSFKMVAVDTSSYAKREFKVKKYIQEILLGLHNFMKAKKVDIDLQIDEELSIFSFPGIFSQIMTNLIMNSIKHGFANRNEGKININIVNENNELKIDYTNNGETIPDEILEKIFDPFFTTKRNEGGSGLGLNIIYNLIITNLNGTIEAKNLKNGVQFLIKFPL